MDKKPKAKQPKPPKKSDAAIDPEVAKSSDAAVDPSDRSGTSSFASSDDGSLSVEWVTVPDPPQPWEVRTPEQLREELAVRTEYWNSFEHWKLDEALKIFCGIDPGKFDPRSNIHKFYLNVQNVQGTKWVLEHNFGGPLPEWLKRTEWLRLFPAHKTTVSTQGSDHLETSKRKKFSDAQAIAAHKKYIEGYGKGEVTLEALANDMGASRQALVKRLEALGLEWRPKRKKPRRSVLCAPR
jgi:hypothetical protein